MKKIPHSIHAQVDGDILVPIFATPCQSLTRGCSFDLISNAINRSYNVDRSRQQLQPLPYHLQIRDYLKQQEPELWNWFSSAQAQSDYTEALRLDLLKSTYRLDPENHAALYLGATDAQTALELSIPLTIYQSQQTAELNACLYYIPGEAHVVLSGPLLSLLSPEEMKSLIGHELAHYVLWQEENGEFLIVDRLLQAIACDPRAESTHVQSARWFRLYTEIYADRGSFLVTQNLDSVVAGLVKTLTGLQQVSAASYLKQAEEIFQKTKIKTAELSHPEAFIRARALALWSGKAADASGQISQMIEGTATLDELDLLGQVHFSSVTRNLLEQFLRPKWFQTNAVLGHAKLFFEDFTPAHTLDESYLSDLRFTDPKLREYISFLLLDFAVADPELEQMPLAAALRLAEQLEIDKEFQKIVSKELKIRAKDLDKLKAEAPELLANAGKAA